MSKRRKMKEEDGEEGKATWHAWGHGTDTGKWKRTVSENSDRGLGKGKTQHATWRDHKTQMGQHARERTTKQHDDAGDRHKAEWTRGREKGQAHEGTTQPIQAKENTTALVRGFRTLVQRRAMMYFHGDHHTTHQTPFRPRAQSAQQQQRKCSQLDRQRRREREQSAQQKQRHRRHPRTERTRKE